MSVELLVGWVVFRDVRLAHHHQADGRRGDRVTPSPCGLLASLKAALAKEAQGLIHGQADLEARYRLLLSLPGVGPIVAMSLVVRMPELGRMKRGQAAALLGVAPYDRDSGQLKGHRFIGGGRRRPRRLVYLAALAAKRSDPSLKAFAQTLSARGKPAMVVNVAVMRRLIEAANLVLARGQPWERRPDMVAPHQGEGRSRR